MSILDHFPAGMTPRQDQIDLLKQIEEAWDSHDVFCLQFPTAWGKTAAMYTIAKWRAARGDTATLTAPDNGIADQIHRRHPDIPILRRKGAYTCATRQTDCSRGGQNSDLGPCPDCPAVQARRTVEAAQVRIANYHVYWAYKLYSDVVMFDEGHKVVDMMADKADVVLACKKYGIPKSLRTCGDLLDWIQKYQKDRPYDEVLDNARLTLVQIGKAAAAKYYNKFHALWVRVYGDGAKMAQRFLWPPKVRKVVLLSATLNAEDVREMGLESRRVFYLTAPSPIPPRNRPVVPLDALNMASKYRHLTVSLLVELIQTLLRNHPEKGLIHLTYELAQQVAAACPDPRLLFHSKYTKAAVLQEFRDSPAGTGKVLVASGMYEGIDLPYDSARWQLIGVVPFLYLGDARIAEKQKERPDWYAWEAIKRVIQAAGRIVRAPDDYGVTYIADTQFRRLREEDRRRAVRLIPPYFTEAIRNAT